MKSDLYEDLVDVLARGALAHGTPHGRALLLRAFGKLVDVCDVLTLVRVWALSAHTLPDAKGKPLVYY